MRHEKVQCLIGFVLLALTFSGCAIFNFAGTKLVDDGNPCADIVIADKPPRMVKLAAEELQAYIEKISGAKLKITNAPGSDVPAHIYVGRSAFTDKLKITDAGLKYGAFRMVSGSNWLVLLGHDNEFTPPKPYMSGHGDRARTVQEWDSLTGENWGLPYWELFKNYNSPELGWELDERGSLNAVYEFLRLQGVRWYLPDPLGEIVPRQASLELSEINKTVQPDFALRFPLPVLPALRRGPEPG